MKKILITGANSYVGTSFHSWIKKYSSHYFVKSISVRDSLWREEDFSQYDTILHVAAVVHVNTKNFSVKQEQHYYRVNRDLPIQIAKKAKKSGVSQFIFMSSMSVYNENSTNGVINIETVPDPSSLYGRTKLQAEKGLQLLESDCFKVALLRPPMIYGRNSKGNYPKLAKLATKSIMFPNIQNRRSMLYIDNLCCFLKLIIDNNESGIFFPQNKEYVRTSEMVKLIAKTHDKNIIVTTVLNPPIYLLRPRIKLLHKVFGSLVYEKSMSTYKEDYQAVNFEQSIIRTEKNF